MNFVGIMKRYKILPLEFTVGFAPLRPAGFVNSCGAGRVKACFSREGAAYFSAGRGGASIPGAWYSQDKNAFDNKAGILQIWNLRRSMWAAKIKMSIKMKYYWNNFILPMLSSTVSFIMIDDGFYQDKLGLIWNWLSFLLD